MPCSVCVCSGRQSPASQAGPARDSRRVLGPLRYSFCPPQWPLRDLTRERQESCCRSEIPKRRLKEARHAVYGDSTHSLLKLRSTRSCQTYSPPNPRVHAAEIPRLKHVEFESRAELQRTRAMVNQELELKR
jgi:hypothetical protein